MPLYFAKAFVFMEHTELIPQLFRTEYQKIVAVLCSLFGIRHMEIAEDIVSETFLAATELWGVKGMPENPTAWLYTVAKNKTKNYLKRHALFEQKLVVELRYESPGSVEIEIDLSHKNIADSQLAMIFTVCDPAISGESQIALALNLLCGFGIDEIADAFLTNKEVIYKRIQRAKERLKSTGLKMEQPTPVQIENRLEVVLATLYLLFSEGYYSSCQNTVLRKELCEEAMRMNYLLIENPATDQPAVNALFALMCFHASRFEARASEDGEAILYADQDEKLWDRERIENGRHFLNKASTGSVLSKYHLEAGIAYWHTQQEDTPEKWNNILQLYNKLLILQYTPIAALNRTFALAQVHGKPTAITEAEKLQLTDNHFYYSLLGYLYTGTNTAQALAHFEKALELAKTPADKTAMRKSITRLKD
jgi:RNA polymerase sigma factor (sigma-70 family)